VAHSLPASPSLEHLRNQAKALLKAIRAQDPSARDRLKRYLPNLGEPARLSNAQFVIAREHGFPSWPRLRTYVDSVTGVRASRRRPLSADIDWFSDRAEGLSRSHRDAIPTTLAQIREFHPGFSGLSDGAIRGAEFTLEDARIAVAREHGFDSWRQFGRHLKDLSAGKTAEPFLTAFDAIKDNDSSRLAHLLEQDPSLVNAPGTNGNTLLNLAVSCRQPDCVEALLAAGADINRANKYGWTPLHQAAYTNQGEIARRFIQEGGSLQLSARGDGGTPLVQALFWGHRDLAEDLARHGVFPCNLRVAAGLGRLDLVESFFDSSGKLTAEAGHQREFYRPHPGFPTCTPTDNPQEILDDALLYAAKNGRINILQFLVDRGANVDGAPCRLRALNWVASNEKLIDVMEWLLDHGADVHGCAGSGAPIRPTPLHEAASSGNLAGVRLLLERGGDNTLRESEYNSTPLGWANHFGRNETRDYLIEHAALDSEDAAEFGKPGGESGNA